MPKYYWNNFAISFTMNFYISLSTFILLAPFSLVAQSSPELKQMLKDHNYWRTEYKVPLLKWSNELEKKSKIWATKLVAENCAVKHDYSDDVGENIYYCFGKIDTTANNAVKGWAYERNYYNFKAEMPRKGFDCSYFIQLIQKDAKEVGCATAIGNECKIIVCKYSPVGVYR